MKLEKLYTLESGDTISYDESQELNGILALVNIYDIPREQTNNVREYLESAFSINSVQAEHYYSLVKLLDDLKTISE